MYVYEGFYTSFDEAQAIDLGFSSDHWLNGQQQLLEEIHHSRWHDRLPLDQNLALIIANFWRGKNRSVRVLDIGGGLGSTYFWLKKVLPDSLPLEYRILELPAAVERANQIKHITEAENLHISTKADNLPRDIIYFGSSLHYFEDWQQQIKDAIHSDSEYVVLARTPVCQKGSFVTLQNYYESKIPVNVIGMSDLVNTMKNSGFTLHFKNPSCSPILGKYQPIPVNDIPPDYDIGFCTDLVFVKE